MEYKNYDLIISENDLINIPPNFEKAQFYKFKLKDTTIGFALINTVESNINSIYISILENYRGNGHGKVLFDMVLNAVKKDYEEIILDVENNNYRMMSILHNKKALELSHVNGIKRFLIKL